MIYERGSALDLAARNNFYTVPLSITRKNCSCAHAVIEHIWTDIDIVPDLPHLFIAMGHIGLVLFESVPAKVSARWMYISKK